MTTHSKPPLESTIDPAACATRITHIEAEHARIDAMFKKATQAFVWHAASSEINAILLELSGYTLTHIREEEELMQFYSFPGLQAHKAEHDRLSATIRGLLDMNSKQEALQGAVSALKLWLDAHIRTTDQLFLDFLRSQPKPL